MLVGTLVVTASSARAQNFGDSPVEGIQGSPGDPGTEAPGAFGLDHQWTVFHVSKFEPMDGIANPDYYGNGYIRPATEGDEFWAQVDLPTGAEIHAVMWHIYDGTASGSWSSLQLVRYQAARTGTTPDEDIIQDFSSGWAATPDYAVLQDPDGLPVIVRAYEDIDGSGGKDFVAYVLYAYCWGTPLSQLRLFGVTIYWRRVISPAPASPTFPDVAPGYWAYQEIEALAAAEITTGYPDGTFRPTNPVTRAQMATFLARALGLHWRF